MASTANEELEPPRKRTRRHFTDTVTILIGKEEKKFMAYKDVITESSDFFRAACNRTWKEGKEGLVRLPDIAPPTFEVYIGWLYTDEVDIVDHEPTQDSPGASARDREPDSEALRGFLDLLVACFALGDMLQDVHFMNSVVDRFITQVEDTGSVPPPCCIARLCDTVPLDSTLTRVCVDYAAFDTQPELFDEDVDEYPAVFVTMSAKASVRDREGPIPEADRAPWLRKPCFYHQHPGGKGRTATCSDTKSERSEGT